MKRSGTRLTFLAMLLPSVIRAGAPGRATVAAWDEYVHSAIIANEQRASAGERFLWIEETPERMASVRAGEVVVSPADTQTPRRVVSGLIHDWVGAVFIPQASLNDVLQVIHDYSRYKDWFQPAVVDSKAIATTGSRDRFSMLLVNRSFFRNLALDADYESSWVRIDDRSGYSIARTTRIREVEEYGTSGRHVLPDGEGAGIIWRLFSITRYLERDGGVYVEIQAIALSRDIPVSLRWVIAPIVRHISSTSLATYLRQTANAVRDRKFDNEAAKCDTCVWHRPVVSSKTAALPASFR